MASEENDATATGEWDRSHRPVVVAVDGSERNRSAVDWAATEAASAGCELMLVTVVDHHEAPGPFVSIRAKRQQAENLQAQAILADLETELRASRDDQDIRTRVISGSPVGILVEEFTDARTIVVGKRGLGAFSRVIVGSTSIAVAGRARVPVTVVPDSWKQDDHRDGPVVIGIDPYRPDHHPIHLAFSRAERLGVPLVAVHGWEPPASYAWEAAVPAWTDTDFEQMSHTEFDKVLVGWREHFPDLEVHAVHSHGHPAMAVLDAAEEAQLVVLGRHSNSRMSGFAFGSVTRAVLHYSTCPVIVVPTDSD